MDLIAGALVWCQPSRGGMAGRRGALALIGAVTLLGLLAGVAFAAASSPRPAVDATVLIQPGIPGEAYVNNPLIVERAALGVSPAISLQALQSQVQISRTSSRIVEISAASDGRSPSRRLLSLRATLRTSAARTPLAETQRCAPGGAVCEPGTPTRDVPVH